MSYVEDICLALIRTLDHATFHKDVRLAGYAANAKFWADEIRHAMDCLAGFESRFAKLKQARQAAAEARKIEMEVAWITPSLTPSELERLSQRLEQSATAFLRACRPALQLSDVQDFELLLGIRIRDRRRDVD